MNKIKLLTVCLSILISQLSHAGVYSVKRRVTNTSTKEQTVKEISICTSSGPQTFKELIYMITDIDYPAKNGWTCNVDYKNKVILCTQSGPNMFMAINASYYEDLNKCKKEFNIEKKNDSSLNANNNMLVTYHYYYMNYETKSRHSSVVGASQACYELKSDTKKLKQSIEQIAKNEGYIGKGCQPDAFPGGFSCHKNSKNSRTYKYFADKNICLKDLKSLKSNYGLE